MLIIVAVIYYSFYSLMPQQTTIESFEKDFSIQKALLHLKSISKKPHFVGAENHTEVRNYIVKELEKLGLTVHIQKTTAFNNKWKAACKVNNIVAKIKGTQQGKALMILTHYDSAPHSSLGASDAGSGVVTILEAIRVFLQKHPKPKNDVIICISDAEELGLLGAKAFVNEHKWAKEVGLVLNLEARGSGGPSYMLIETNGGNSKMIEAFQKAKPPFPVASSLMYSVYKMLPNDTDLTVFREEGNIDGFNFAFIDDHFDYHTEQDSYERMDINTLHHQASYVTSLLPYFSNANLQLTSDRDYVYFNVPKIGLVYYPFSWVIPIFAIVVGVFIVLLILGFYKNRLTFKGVLKGFLPFVMSLLISGLLAVYGWRLLLKIYPQYNDILQGFTYNGHTYIIAFVSASLAICFYFYKSFLNKNTLQDILIAPIFFWLLLNGGMAFYLQGGAYFVLPAITLIICLALFIFSKSESKMWISTLLVLPSLLIITPLVQIFPIGLGLKMMISSTVLVVFLFGLLLPVIAEYRIKKHFSKLFFTISLLAFVAGHFTSEYDENQKKPNSILYVMDADENKAYWASYDRKIDAFTKQFLGENPKEGNLLGGTIASKYNTSIKRYENAPLKKMEKPFIEIISDTIIGDFRKVTLSICSARNANRFEIINKSETDIYDFCVNNRCNSLPTKNKPDDTQKGSILNYFITEPDERIVVGFSILKQKSVSLDILESKYDLFTNEQFTIMPRSKDMMPTPFILNDATVIKTKLDILPPSL